MSKQPHLQELLQDYVDGLCNPQQQSEIKQLIDTEPEWQLAYEQLLELNELLRAPEMQLEPSMRFSKNVLEAIKDEKIAKRATAYINPMLVYGIMGMLCFSLVTILLWGLLNFSPDHSDFTIKLPELASMNFEIFQNRLLIQGFAGLNIILALVIIEKWLKTTKQKTKIT